MQEQCCCTCLSLFLAAAANELHTTVCCSRIDVWREASSKLLKNKFPKGVDFMVLTPRFNTLSQQTMQRVLRANLAAVSQQFMVKALLE